MHNDELIERSPVRAVAAAVRGGLEPGQTGAIMARAGVGKSAFLARLLSGLEPSAFAAALPYT